MYIAPNTTVVLLHNCPLENNYEHTIYFTSETAQVQYFLSLQKYTLGAMTYQRVNSNKMRIAKSADALYDCNYMMFQNTNYSGKWFYAFINQIDYVNNETSEITYQIDVLQTWHFAYTPDMCFVEREHSATDILYGNIEAENLDCGTDMVANETTTVDFNDMKCVVLRAYDAGETAPDDFSIKATQHVLNGVHIGTATLGEAASAISSAINDGTSEKIVALYQYPSKIEGLITSYWNGPAGLYDENTAWYQFNVYQNTTDIDGYTPKNKKLFSYPYSQLVLSNNNGQTNTYHWELGNSVTKGQLKFGYTGTIMTSPAVFCFPCEYRGVAVDTDNGLVINNFPKCPWSSDAWAAYWAQNGASASQSVISSVLSSAVSFGIGGATGTLEASDISDGIMSPLTSIGSLLAKKQDLENSPGKVGGLSNTDNLTAATKRYKFTFYNMTIRTEYAINIDQYFTRYGYATNRFKVPNRNVRPHWTFTKTVGCHLKTIENAGIPSDDIATICSIYDRGVTWWLNGSEIGNLSLDNSV